MPNSIVIALIAKVAALEANVKSLIAYQKWQMGMLGAIILIVLKTLVGK